MKKETLLVLIALLSVAAGAFAQSCQSLGLVTRSRCPNPGCGERYANYQTSPCSPDSFSCAILRPVQICCGAYQSYAPTDPCTIAKFRGRESRSRLLELARASRILVPNCRGAYVPARMVLERL